MNEIRQNVDKIPKALFDSQQTAQFLFGIKLNNLVSTLGLTAMMAIDAAFHFYIIVMQILKQYQGSFLSLSPNVIEQYLCMQSLSSYLIVQIAILSSFLSLLSLLIALLYLQNTRNRTYHCIEKPISVVFSALMTCLQIPLLEIIIGTFFSNLGALNDGSASYNAQIGILYLFSIVNLVLLLSFVYFLTKLYVERIPCISAPYASSSSQMEHTKVIGKILLVISHLYITKGGQTPIYIVAASFVIFGGSMLYKVLVISHYNKMIAWMSRLSELITTSLLLILLVQTSAFSTENQTSSMSVIFIVMVAITIFPGMIELSVILNKYREDQVWARLVKGQLKNEIDQEYALNILIDRLHQCFGAHERENYMALAELLYLIEVHSRACFNPECACHKMELMQYFMNKSYVQNQTCVPLEIEEVHFMSRSGLNDYFDLKSDPSKHQAALSQKRNLIETQRIIESPAELNGPNSLNDYTQDMTTNHSGLKIDTLKFKRSLICKVIKTFFDVAKSKHPHSTLIFYQNVTFALRCCLNKYITQALLLNFCTSQVGAQKRSWLEQVSIKFNELYTLMQLDNLEDNKFESQENPWGFVSGERTKGHQKNETFSFLQQFDATLFISSSQLKMQFYDQTDKLALSVQFFWRCIQQSTLNVAVTQQECIRLAETIDAVFKLFNRIQGDSESQTQKSGRQIDERLLYTFALVQKMLLNDVAQHDLYQGKLNSQKNLIKLLQNNMMHLGQSSNKVGFMHVSGLTRTFGDILILNQVFQDALQYSSSELNTLNIANIMPTIIGSWHQQFVSEFTSQQNTSLYMINKVMMLFVKQKCGYVIPAILNIKFHYSHEYEYAFSCFATFLDEMRFARADGVVKHPIEQVMFLLCSDDDWRVLEISESCTKLLGLPLQNAQGQYTDDTLTLESLIPSFSIQKLKHLNVAKGLCCLEETVQIDLNAIQSVESSMSVITQIQMKRAYCQIFKEYYGMNRDKCLNIVTLVMLEESSSLSDLQRQTKLIIPSSTANGHEPQLRDSVFNGLQSISMLPGQQFDNSDDLIDDGGSQSDTSVSYQTEASEFKQLISQSEKKSSKNLTLISQLLFLVFALLIALSSINVVLSNGKYSSLQTQIAAVSYAYTRITAVAYIRSMIRGMLSQANGIGQPTYALQIARFNSFQQGFQSKLIVLQQAQAYLDRPDAVISATLSNMLADKSVTIAQIDENDNPIYSNYTFNVAINLYISRASQVAYWSFANYTGNLSQIRLIATPPHYTPTPNERTFYYLVMTGMGNMRTHSVALVEQYRQDAEDSAQYVAQITLITIIVSILVILLVCFILSPIIFRVEQHKYIGMQFFLEVDRKKLAILEQQAQGFMEHMAKNSKTSEIGKSQLRGQVLEQVLGKNINPVLNSSEDSIEQQCSQFNAKKVHFAEDNKFKNREPLDQKQQTSPRYPSQQNPNFQSDLNNSALDDRSFNKLQIDAEGGNVKQEEDQNVQTHDENQNEQSIANDKFNMIKKIIDRQKIKVVLIVMMIGLCLSSYFVAAYFFSVQPFLEVPTYLGHIDMLHMLDYDILNMVSFIREDLVLNMSISAVEDPSLAASDYFLQQFLDGQDQYLQFRKNLPPIYSSLSGFFSAIETGQVCNVTFQGTVNASASILTCATSVNGLMLTGLTDTLAYLYKNQKTNRLDFIENKHTLAFLMGQIRDVTTSAVLGLRQQTLSPLLSMIEGQVIQATIVYFKSLGSSYLILFGAFIIALVILFSASVIFVYRNIRRNMRKTNLTLKILPIEYLPKDVLPQLKKFSTY